MEMGPQEEAVREHDLCDDVQRHLSFVVLYVSLRSAFQAWIGLHHWSRI